MAERPVECSCCKKTISILYKEIVGNQLIDVEMCADCPFLQKKLHGENPSSSQHPSIEGKSSLYCNNCKTSFESVKMGNPLGCSECYSVFTDILIQELSHTHQLPLYLTKGLLNTKTQPLHMGKAPNQSLTILASTRLTSLNEALNEALKIENYEQAAWLRDQINALTEKPNEKKDSPSP